MKKSKFTEEQIAYVLRQVKSGTPPADACRQMGVSELRQLRSLEDENARLKRLVATCRSTSTC
jgi:putative transposase